MGINFRNGVDKMGIKTTDEMGIDEMRSYPILSLVRSSTIYTDDIWTLNI